LKSSGRPGETNLQEPEGHGPHHVAAAASYNKMAACGEHAPYCNLNANQTLRALARRRALAVLHTVSMPLRWLSPLPTEYPAGRPPAPAAGACQWQCVTPPRGWRRGRSETPIREFNGIVRSGARGPGPWRRLIRNSCQCPAHAPGGVTPEDPSHGAGPLTDGAVWAHAATGALRTLHSETPGESVPLAK
jgi:hypothetical protein